MFPGSFTLGEGARGTDSRVRRRLARQRPARTAARPACRPARFPSTHPRPYLWAQHTTATSTGAEKMPKSLPPAKPHIPPPRPGTGEGAPRRRRDPQPGLLLLLPPPPPPRWPGAEEGGGGGGGEEEEERARGKEEQRAGERREGEEARRAGGGAGCAAHPGLPRTLRGQYPGPWRSLPPPRLRSGTWSPAGDSKLEPRLRGAEQGRAPPRNRLRRAPCHRANEGTDGGTGRGGEGNAIRFPPPLSWARPPLRPPPSCDTGRKPVGSVQCLCPRDCALQSPERGCGSGESPHLTCGVQSLESPGSRRARWAAGEPGAWSTWRCSSDLIWVGSALPRSH